MGYTNKTSHFELPQWIAGDKPSWLGDMNTAMLNIDTAIAASAASASAAESSAAAANAQVQAQDARITKNATDIQALTENLADTQGNVNNVKTIAESALPKSGGTMTGALTLSGDPTGNLQAATKQYVDNQFSVVPLTPTSMWSGSLNAAIVNGVLMFSGYGSLSGPYLAECAGNPLNLDATPVFCGTGVNAENLGTFVVSYANNKTTIGIGTTSVPTGVSVSVNGIYFKM